MTKVIFADGTTIILEGSDLPLESLTSATLTLTFESGLTEIVILPEVLTVVEEE
jgi:hypothetical protein